MFILLIKKKEEEEDVKNLNIAVLFIFFFVVAIVNNLVLVRGNGGLFIEHLFQDICIARLDALVILLFFLDDFKSEFFVKLNGDLVADLNVSVQQQKNKYIYIFKRRTKFKLRQPSLNLHYLR